MNEESLAQAVLGTREAWRAFTTNLPRALRAPLERALHLAGSETYGVPLLAGLFAALVFLPYLGAVGLWDPWETHYAEVAREMLEGRDWVHPRWEGANFFSKPVLTMWLMLPGLGLSGAGSAEGPLSLCTEWLVRLPFAGLAVLAVAQLSFAVGKLASRRAGLATGFALATSPLYFFVARQAMTDMPFVAALTCCLSWAALALFDGDERRRVSRWRWAFFWAAVGALGKGLLGVALPVAVLGGLALARSLWGSFGRPDLLARAHPAKGASAGGVLCRWWRRAAAGLAQVPWGSGAALFFAVAGPWYALMLAYSGTDPEGLTFFQRFFLHDHLARLTRGVHTTTPGGTFVYYLEQLGFGCFPWVALVPLAAREALLAKAKGPRGALALLAWLWLIVSLALFTSSATRFHHYILPAVPALAVLVGLSVDRLWREGLRPAAPALAAGGALFLLVLKDLWRRPRHLLDLFTYNHERPYPDFLLSSSVWGSFTRVDALALCVLAFAVVAVLGACLRRKALAFAAFWCLSAGLSLWLSWSHWVELSHHWTQRDLFWRYQSLSKPDEPIAAFWMDWKGETFYSRNRVVQIKPNNDAQQTRAFLGRPGRQWVLVEHSRLSMLARAAGEGQRLTPVDPALNDKFVLVAVDDTP